MKLRWLTIGLLIASPVMADTASRLYTKGKYDESLQRYQNAAKEQPENWPLLYNLGAAAYKAGKADEAAQAFERATASPDRLLQAKAFYNLGNAHYRLGEVAEPKGPEQAMPVFEKALKGYEGALALDPKDDDAKFNAALVKKKLEELKKKQEEQQQQQQQKQDQDKKDQQQKQDQQKQDQQKQEEQQKKEEQEKQQQQQEKKDQQKPEQQPQPQPAEAKDNLDKKQAEAMLDNLREEEKNWNFFPELQMKAGQDTDPSKDW
jgi:Ca-activated chloride channel homolog